MLLSQQMEIIRRHQAKPPVPVVPIATDLGLRVYKAALPDNVSGMIRKDSRGGPSGYAIFVNERHAETRRRFTIAHECAHFILHRTAIRDGITDDALYRSGLSNAMEVQANRLAADILMPWHLLNAAIDSGMNTVRELAALFNVSPSAMSIRLGVPYEVA